MPLSQAVLQLTPELAFEEYFHFWCIFFFGARVLGLFVNLVSEPFAFGFGKNTICPVLWFADNYNCPCFGSLFKFISLHLLVFVTASLASHLVERKFKHFPIFDCTLVLRI